MDILYNCRSQHSLHQKNPFKYTTNKKNTRFNSKMHIDIAPPEHFLFDFLMKMFKRRLNSRRSERKWVQWLIYSYGRSIHMNLTYKGRSMV